MDKYPGKFITFEGGEGSGKSTQILMLTEKLKRMGIAVYLTREPGGSLGGEEIRQLLVDGEPRRWDAMTETLLHFAARNDHVQKKIRPALKEGRWVLCDRFADSTFAYQGYGHGLDNAILEQLYHMILGDFQPDLTFVLDLPVETGLERAAKRGGGEDRYERMRIDFHKRLRSGYLQIISQNPERCQKINANRGIDIVGNEIWTIASSRFHELA